MGSNGMDNVIENKTGYNSKTTNFIIDQELAVTITLDEYRQLVTNNAVAQSKIDEANKDKYERNKKIEELEKENEKLKSELYEARKTVDELKKESHNFEPNEEEEEYENEIND